MGDVYTRRRVGAVAGAGESRPVAGENGYWMDDCLLGTTSGQNNASTSASANTSASRVPVPFRGLSSKAKGGNEVMQV